MNAENLASWFEQTGWYLLLAVILALLIFLALFWYFFAYFALALKKHKRLPKSKINYKYAILIPARNEDQVISHILESLKNQTYPKELFDVYVIVESKDDPTIKITKKFKYNIVIRKDLINKRTKGFALDEAYKFIKENGKTYDAFMVFDADNIVKSDYIELMNDVKNAGFKVGMGYRNFTNASKNWISACSSTLFAYMNQFTSNGRSVLFKKMTLTGTGYFIDFDIIDNEGGWIFNGMTEDVELTKYCYYHNISMKYYPLAQYYDEQPTTIKTVHKQHIRWVWGFFANDKKYKKKNSPNYHALDKTKQNISLFEFNVSIYPLVLMGALLGLAFLISFGFFIASLVFAAFLEPFRTNLVPLSMFIWMLIYFIILWISVGLVAFVTFVISNRYLKFSILLQIKVILTYLFFFIDFVLAFLDGLFHKYKRVSWDKIDHYGVITNKEALENLKNESKARK